MAVLISQREHLTHPNVISWDKLRNYDWDSRYQSKWTLYQLVLLS